MIRILLAAFIGISASTMNAEEIPLKSIWAYGMAGTQDARKLSKELTNDLATWLMRRTGEGGKAGKSFLVTGQGDVALQGAANVLMGGAKRPTKLAGTEASLVFYSFAAPGYVTIDSIEREDGKVTVRFKVTTHEEAMATTHFALIPLGKLPAGKLEVEIVEVDPDKPYSNKERTKRAVCKSCTINVEEGAKKK
jgi:hypothetical protein